MIEAPPHVRRVQPQWWGKWAAAAICILFFAVQIGTLNYGTTINNRPHIARYQIQDPGAAGSALQRRNLILNKTTFEESPRQAVAALQALQRGI